MSPPNTVYGVENPMNVHNRPIGDISPTGWSSTTKPGVGNWVLNTFANP